MIHTMTIIKTLTYDEFIRLYNNLKNNGAFFYTPYNKKNNHEKEYPETEYKATNKYKDIGIKELLFVETKSIYYGLEMKLNPKHLLETDNYINITTKQEILAAIKRFNKVTKQIDLSFPEFYDWNVKEIHYAVDINTKWVEKYIKLFQRSDKPPHFHELYSKTGKRYTQMPGSFYLVSNGDRIRINFYDKYYELTNKQNEVPYTERGKNTLRIEVQYKHKKLCKLKEKDKISDLSTESLVNSVLSSKAIIKYFIKTVGTGDYYTLQEAKRLIASSNFSEKKIKKMILVLDLINEKRSIWKAREYISNSNVGKEKKLLMHQYNCALANIRKLDINPVTIPQRWDVTKLKNPLQYILEYYQ